jgi:hypothetical protein
MSGNRKKNHFAIALTFLPVFLLETVATLKFICRHNRASNSGSEEEKVKEKISLAFVDQRFFFLFLPSSACFSYHCRFSSSQSLASIVSLDQETKFQV